MLDARHTEVDFSGSRLLGAPVGTTVRSLGDMRGFFSDEEALQGMAPETEVYRVDAYMPVEPGTEGGLFFGITHIRPGLVGEEYFMTKGHFHTVGNRAEYYWGIAGRGFLILMDSQRRTWAEQVRPGSLHYIRGYTAHRLVNIGESVLDVGACWPADAGHEYGVISEDGFGLRVVQSSAGVNLLSQ